MWGAIFKKLKSGIGGKSGGGKGSANPVMAIPNFASSTPVQLLETNVRPVQPSPLQQEVLAGQQPASTGLLGPPPTLQQTPPQVQQGLLQASPAAPPALEPEMSLPQFIMNQKQKEWDQKIQGYRDLLSGGGGA